MKIELSKSAAKAIGRMDTVTKRRIRLGIENLPRGDVKKLQGYLNAYRLRVGDWRILFDMDVDSIRVTNILPRGDAYK